MKEYFSLLMEFIRFGCFTFGGGWSIIAQMQQLYVEKRQVITSQELLDLTSVAKSLPGVMIANVAMLYGCRAGGFVCGLVCVIAMITPPMIVLSLITYFYTLFKENVWVMSAMTGVRCAIVPIIISAAVNMVKGAFRFPPCYLLTAIAFALYLFLNVSCVVLVIMGVIGGIIICEIYERREAKSHDSNAA